MRTWCWAVLVSSASCTSPGTSEPPPAPPEAPPAHHGEGVVPDVAPAFVHDAGLRRLSRAEYVRSVEALLGVPVTDELAVPVDPDTRGFDDQADALDVTPLVFEAYESVSERLVARALRRPGLLLEDWTVEVSPDLPARDDGWRLVQAGVWTARFVAPEQGTWRLTFPLEIDVGAPLGDTTVTLWVDDAPWGTWTTPTVSGRVTNTFTFVEPAGAHELVVQLQPSAGVAGYAVGRAAVDGPLERGANPARDALVTCDLDRDPVGCTRTIVEGFASRAFRRPVEADDLDALMTLPTALAEQGAEPDEVLGVALRTVLVHPRFLFRLEPDDRAGARRELDAWELAHRLAATVWVSLPDDKLLAVAESGAILTDRTLRTQTRRMLADPRAEALADVFLADWLDLSVLDQASPDPMVFPTFDEPLREAMREELQALTRGVVAEGVPLHTLLTATTGTVPPRLAEHYGLGPLASSEGVDLAAVGRGGLLGTAGLLTKLAHPDRGSPTIRGKFVLDRLLCDPPSPPPGSVPALAPGTTNQERVEAHASNPVCAGCHMGMDPIGLALEHFDGVGGWRDTEAGVPVAGVGELPDGTALDGLQGVVGWLVDDPRWPRCAARQLFTWSLGRPPGADEPTVEAIAQVIAGGGSLRDAVEALVLSEPFRARKGAP